MLKKLNIFIIILGLIIIYYFVNDFGLDQIIINIKKSGFDLFWVIFVWAVIYFLNALVSKIIIGNKGEKVGIFELFGLTISAYSINLVTPFVSLGGEPYKIIELQNKLGTKRATSSTLLYTILHMLAHTFFWLIGFAIAFFFFEYSILEMIVLIILLAFVFLLVWFFFSRLKKGVARAFANLGLKLKFWKSLKAKIEKYETNITEIDLQIIDFYKNRKKDFWLAFSIELFARVLTSFEIYLILISIGVSITIFEAIYLTAAFTLLMNLIFFVPMELGTRESSLYFLVKGLYSLDGVGVYVAIISRIREVFWIVLGIILIQIRGLINKKKAN